MISQSMRYDGDGFLVKKSAVTRSGSNQTLTTDDNYDIRSSVLGGEIVYSTGTNGTESFVRANGTLIATVDQSQNQQTSVWRHKDPGISSLRSSDSSGAMITTSDDGNQFGKLELDPQGNNVGYTDWWALSQQGTPDPVPDSGFEPIQTIRNGQPVRHNVNGMDIPASYFRQMVSFAFGGEFGLIEWQARFSRGVTPRKPPVLKRAKRLSPEELKKRKELAATGRFDSEPVEMSGMPAPLNAAENAMLDEKIAKISKQLESDPCRSFLLKTIGEDGIQRLTAQLSDQTLRFSAERSTDITVEQAGLYRPFGNEPDPREEATQLMLSGNRVAGASLHATLNRSVSDWFTSHPNVMAAIGSGGRVFYRSFDRVRTVLHENLHLSEGLNDVDLARRLGLRMENGDVYTDTNQASQAISAALATNKCT